LTYLLDVNLLIALAWPSHIHHMQAQDWFARKGAKGWASCPISQAGFVRVSSNPKFIDGAVSPLEAITLLKKVTHSTKHEFWRDEVNLAGKTDPVFNYLVGHRQVTDAYLLALAVLHAGMLASFDPGIRSLLPDGAGRKKYLEIIGTD
jgi:toxin-antitoxin system PIN domain toxin